MDSIEYYESGVETSSSEFLDEMDSLAKWINETDFTQNDNYEILKEKIDIDNFCTFLATDVLVGNYDCMIGFDHNLIVWKSDEINEENEYCDGRLRWIPIDMDSTLFSTGSSAAVLDTLINQEVEKVKGNRISIILFQQLWKRIDFRIMLSQKIYEIGDVYFNVNRIEEKYDEHYQLLSREIDENIARLEMGVNGTVSSVLSLLGIEIDLRENLTRAEWEGSMATLKGNLLTQFDAVKEEIRKYGAYELSDVYAEVKADSTYEGYSLFASGFSGVANDGNENYVWTTGNSSVFHVLLNEDYKEMTGIRMAINEIPITENQRCDVYVNGEYLTETVLGLGTVNIDIPARYFVNRYAEIELMWKDAKSPKELLIGEDETLLACRIYSVQFFDLQDVLINVEKNISLKGEELEKAIINGSVISVTDETGEYIWSVGNYTEWEFLIVAKTKIRVYCSGITTEQRVKVIINDRYVSTVVADDVFEFDILEGDSVNDIVKIRFEYLDAASPKELGINEQETIFAIRIYKMEFEIE